MNSKTILISAAVSGALAVGLGAFGAHALKAFLAETARTGTYQTAVTYHFYHTLALLATGILAERLKHKAFGRAGLFMLIGLILFSGSLYILCLTKIASFGMVTPFGGVLLIVAWLQLALALQKSLKNR